MAWHGFFLMTLKGALSGGLTPEQSTYLKQKFGLSFTGLVQSEALQSLYPAYRLQTRLSIDEKKIICEAMWKNEPTKAEIVDVLAKGLGTAGAALLGVPEAALPTALDAGFDVYVFASGGSWEESRAAAASFIESERSEWQTIF